MTKSELIARLASRFSSLTIDDAVASVKHVLEALTDNLRKGDRIEIRGFGSFSLNTRAARNARNPKSGERVSVPSKSVPHFKAGKKLRERVDKSS